jgi:hypothetical protein
MDWVQFYGQSEHARGMRVHCRDCISPSAELSACIRMEPRPIKRDGINPSLRFSGAGDFVVDGAEDYTNEKAHHERVTKADDASKESDPITGEKVGQ